MRMQLTADAGDDIPWIQSLTKLPIIIKGIQCTEVGLFIRGTVDARH